MKTDKTSGEANGTAKIVFPDNHGLLHLSGSAVTALGIDCGTPFYMLTDAYRSLLELSSNHYAGDIATSGACVETGIRASMLILRPNAQDWSILTPLIKQLSLSR